MKSYLASEDLTIVVPFLRDGEPFLADTGSVTYQVRDQDGTLLDSGSLTVAATDTYATVVVAAADNAISTRFEKRTVIIKGTVGPQNFELREQYRLTEWLNYSATQADVRKFIGVGTGELPDDVIDLVDAYLKLEARTTEATLTAALASGTISEVKANDGIIAQSVLTLIPSLRQRISLKESDGPASAQREKIDLDRIGSRAADVLSEAITAISGRQVETQTLLVFGVTNDIFEA